MPVKHVFTSAVADAGVAGEIGPSEWNDDHASPPFVVTLVGTATTLSNMVAALTEFVAVNRFRSKVDMTNCTEARLTAALAVVGGAGSELRAQYWTGAAWAYLDGVGGPALSLATLGTSVSAWVTCEAGAKADAEVRLVTINGDGLADPVVGTVTIQFR